MEIHSAICQIIIRVLDVDGVSIAGGGTTPDAPIEQPWLLFAAVALCTISFFLLYEAARFHLWVTAHDEAAPSASIGLYFALWFFLFIILASSSYVIVRYPPPDDLRGNLNVIPFWYFLHHPSELAAGLAMASTVPSVIAIYTFNIARFIMRDPGKELPPLARSPRAALAGAIFSLISLAGSIATLIMFFVWMKNP